MRRWTHSFEFARASSCRPADLLSPCSGGSSLPAGRAALAAFQENTPEYKNMHLQTKHARYALAHDSALGLITVANGEGHTGRTTMEAKGRLVTMLRRGTHTAPHSSQEGLAAVTRRVDGGFKSSDHKSSYHVLSGATVQLYSGLCSRHSLHAFAERSHLMRTHCALQPHTPPPHAAAVRSHLTAATPHAIAMAAQVKSSHVKSSQVKSSQVKSSQAKSSQVKSSQVKPSQAKPSQASRVTSRHVKSSRAKRRNV